MSDAADMSTPVTRGELKAELSSQLELVEQRLKAELKAELSSQLELVEQRLKAELSGQLELVEQRLKTELSSQLELVEQRLLTELARHNKAGYESIATLISAIDEKYADLPGRVSRLEESVFPPGRRRARRAR
jgi:hypothetical protein